MPAPIACHRPSRLARLPIFYGWVVVAVAFVTMAIGVNGRTAFSLLYPPILDEFGWERGATAGAFSVGFLVSMLYAPVVGFLMDRWGPRYVIALSALVVSVGFASATLTSQLWQLYASLGVLVVGTSVAMSYIGHGAFLPNWFSRRRGLAIGIAYSGVGVGSILLLPWVQLLIDTGGWRHACWILALLVLAIAPLNLVLQRRRPQDLGLLPDGAPVAEAAPDGTPGHRVVDPAWVAIDWTLRRAASTARFWWLAVGFCCGLYAWYAVLVHQTRYLIDVGFDRSTAAYALALVALFGIAGQIGIGWLSDRIGREWGWTIGSLGFVLSLLLLRTPGPGGPAADVCDGGDAGTARLQPGPGLRCDSGRPVPGPTLRHDLWRLEPHIDARRRRRSLGHRLPARPDRRLWRRLYAGAAPRTGLDRLHLVRGAAQGSWRRALADLRMPPRHRAPI